MVLEALQTWVVPTASIGGAALFWLLSALDVWSEAVAVVGVAAALLVLALFASFRAYFFEQTGRGRQVSVAFALAWGTFVFAVFYRHNFPGAPLATAMLREGSEALSLTHAGLYSVVVDGRFTAGQGQSNRTGHYHIETSAQSAGPAIDGTFEDRFGYQRIGRRGTAPVEYQHTSQRHVVRLPQAASLRVTEIDPSLEPALQVTVYAAIDPWIFPVFGLAGILGALVLEKWLDGDGSATMAASATFFVVDQYLRWAAPHPQMRSLIGAILVGGIIGAPLAALVWRYVPRRWIVRHRS